VFSVRGPCRMFITDTENRLLQRVDCDYTTGVWFSETVIITVLKSVFKKRLVKTKYFYVNSD
jgi:hypothetical protein